MVGHGWTPVPCEGQALCWLGGECPSLGELSGQRGREIIEGQSQRRDVSTPVGGVGLRWHPRSQEGAFQNRRAFHYPGLDMPLDVANGFARASIEETFAISSIRFGPRLHVHSCFPSSWHISLAVVSSECMFSECTSKPTAKTFLLFSNAFPTFPLTF